MSNSSDLKPKVNHDHNAQQYNHHMHATRDEQRKCPVCSVMLRDFDRMFAQQPVQHGSSR